MMDHPTAKPSNLSKDKCGKCNKYLSPSWNYCPRCGTQIETEVTWPPSFTGI